MACTELERHPLHFSVYSDFNFDEQSQAGCILLINRIANGTLSRPAACGIMVDLVNIILHQKEIVRELYCMASHSA